VIVKVQIPLFSNDPDAPALVYSKDRKTVDEMIPMEEIPPHVLLVVETRGGKAYFNCEIDGEAIMILDEVENPGW
jgi:hypothetical protein